MGNDRLYKSLSEKINLLFGIHLKKGDWKSMENSLLRTAKLLNRKQSIEDISGWLLKPALSEEEYHALATNLTIGETYFFREITGLTLLAEEIIPEIRKSNRKTLNIWSAGCSSGEEPYSIAIFLKENLPDISKWDIKIMATDLNNEALSKAKRAVYRPWSFRGLREDLLKKYFIRHDKILELKPEIKSMVHFSNLNLVKGDFPYSHDSANGYDVIFCRNVLMYFSQPVIKQITEKFYQSLSSEGYMIISQTELSVDIFNLFKRFKFKDGFFFRKGALNNHLKPSAKKNNVLEVPLSKTRAIKKPIRHVKKTTALPGMDKPAPAKKKDRINSLTIMESFSASDFQECIRLFESRNPEGGIGEEEKFCVAKSYANLGNNEKAGRLMKELIAKNSTNPQFYYFYASVLSEEGLWQEAEQNLVKALYLKPDFLPARFNRFLALKKLNNVKSATKEGDNLLSDISTYDNNDLLPDMEGMTAGSLREMIDLMQ